MRPTFGEENIHFVGAVLRGQPLRLLMRASVWVIKGSLVNGRVQDPPLRLLMRASVWVIMGSLDNGRVQDPPLRLLMRACVWVIMGSLDDGRVQGLRPKRYNKRGVGATLVVALIKSFKSTILML